MSTTQSLRWTVSTLNEGFNAVRRAGKKTAQLIVTTFTSANQARREASGRHNTFTRTGIFKIADLTEDTHG